MSEYIYKIDACDSDEDEVFVGWIRHNYPKLIRCKDCKFYKVHELQNVTLTLCERERMNPIKMTDYDFCSRAEIKRR